MTPGSAAYDRLLADYVDYHLALVVVGGTFTLALLVLAGFSWARFAGSKCLPERRVHLFVAAPTSAVGLLLGLVVTANLSNVLNPGPGLAGAIGTPDQVRQAASGELTKSLGAWLRSGSADVPPAIQERVAARLAWQEPKAVFSALLLAGVTLAGVLVWRRVVARARSRGTVGLGLALAGSLTAAGGLVLMLMVIGNVQASYAPITMTLQYG